MNDAAVLVPDVGPSGLGIDNSAIVRGGQTVYRQRVESYPANSFGDLTADAWGVPKVSLPFSLFHGLFTFDIPVPQWFLFESQQQVYTSTNIISENGAGVLRTSAAKPDLVLQSRKTPRYQPNRGHLYSTALWCPNKTADGLREWGLKTPENGVFFRLLPDGKLYAVQLSGFSQIKEELIDTSGVAGFDVEKGNVYDIQYQWRGVGNYRFYINLQLVHTFNNLGTLTALSLQDPALPAHFKALRITEDVEMHVGCVDITSENGSPDVMEYSSAYAQKTVSGTDIPVLCIANPLAINGKTNTRMTEVARISVNCDKKSLFKIWVTRDPTAIVGATFVARGIGSYMRVDSPDTVATAVSATSVNTAKLTLITAIPLAANASAEIVNPDPDHINFSIARGDYFVVTNNVTTGSCEVVFEWSEAI